MEFEFFNCLFGMKSPISALEGPYRMFLLGSAELLHRHPLSGAHYFGCGRLACYRSLSDLPLRRLLHRTNAAINFTDPQLLIPRNNH